MSLSCKGLALNGLAETTTDVICRALFLPSLPLSAVVKSFNFGVFQHVLGLHYRSRKERKESSFIAPAVMSRKEKIARSVVRAITKTNGLDRRPSNPVALILALFSTFFSLYQLILRKIRPADFASLRRQHWDVNDDDYVQSFIAHGDNGGDAPLKAIGDMGFSGSVSLHISGAVSAKSKFFS